MLTHEFDPSQPLRYVRYGRMSSDKQNPRSPEQQFITIESTRQRLGHPWQHVGDYRDDAIKGSFVRRRPGLQKMLQDIRSGAITVDGILVDTYERFGRADEMAQIRRELFVRHGVLILTADSNFSDPNSVSGKALGFVEQLRSTEDGRIKAHNVLRGKRDAAREKKWPGGTAPFGYKLESVLTEVKGRQEVDYSRLVPDQETAWIIQRLYAKAKETGWGVSRLTQYLNSCADIPDKFKPFAQAAVGYWIRSPIYIGQMVWETKHTGIVDDVRIYQRVDPADWVVVPEFCEPLVATDLWQSVQELRQTRSDRMKQSQTKPDGKAITPLAPLMAQRPRFGRVRRGDLQRHLKTAARVQPGRAV